MFDIAGSTSHRTFDPSLRPTLSSIRACQAGYMRFGPPDRPSPKLGPSGVTEAVATRYREILPSVFEIETNGPLLLMRYPGGSLSFFGNFVLHVPLLSAEYRLSEFAKIAFKDLPEHVARVAVHRPEITWAALGTECHVRVTHDDVHVWYGHSDSEDDAALVVRPIPRSDLCV